MEGRDLLPWMYAEGAGAATVVATLIPRAQVDTLGYRN
jgi:hypothetical protein